MSNPLKKTMVYLGLADEEEVYEEQHSATPSPRASQPVADKPVAPVTPIQRPAVVRQPTPAAVSEILTVHPKQYRDAQVIAESFRENIPVIINLSQMSDADARRLIDFASGLSMGLYGRIERVTSKVFLLSPENVTVAGDGAVAQADPDATPFAQQR
jgi:cell division inhibitor SepF